VTVLLHDHLARAADSRPDATALTLGDERLSYGDVAVLSDRLAAALAAHGVEPGDRVGLLVPKQPAAIVAMHAVLKAGAAYVPLDSESPAPRLARIVASADLRLLLTVPAAADRLDELGALLPLPIVASVDDGGVVTVGGRELSAFTRRDWDVDATPPARRVADDAAAHLLFTSGSTGDPKGVVITHRMVTAFVDWAVGYFGTRPTDRISGHPPLHFDLSTFDIYGTFAAGAELHLVPASLSLDPRGLVRFIRDHELTQWFSVPSLLAYVARFDAVEQDDFPTLDRLLWCGEVLPTPVLCHWMRRLPHVRFTNLYGPTEATIASSYHTVPSLPEDETQPVPIGTACAGEELLVLDGDLRPIPVGEIGDLYIAGVGLSPGYWRDDDKTRAAFLDDPRSAGSGERIYRTGDLARVDEDGLVHFLGRADSQIKSRGYRIELGEVESALVAVDGVRECAVVGVETGGFEGTAICAAYVGGDGLEPPALKSALSASLPTYMLPARWLALDVLPKNQNGKIDRPELRKRFAAEAEQESGKG
jgi:amino acid adenylation domain-containing protein